MKVYSVSGNRFLIIPTADFPAKDKTATVIEWAHQHKVDQVLEIVNQAPLSFEVWNKDGSKSLMCGNGACAVVFWASQKGQIDRQGDLVIAGKNYRYTWDGTNAAITLPLPETDKTTTVQLSGEEIEYVPTTVPNPHAVVFYNCDYLFCNQEIDEKQVGRISAEICNAADFKPDGINVQMVKMREINGDTVRLTVTPYERGAGPTQACGSGAIAAAYAYQKRMNCPQTTFEIEMPGGSLGVKIFSDSITLIGRPIVEG